MTGLFSLAPSTDAQGVEWSIGSEHDANPLLRTEHYLGPITAGGYTLIVVGERDGAVVAAQVWRRPTSRMLPPDGSWLELSRWCLTAVAGENAGSRMHRYATGQIRTLLPDVTTLVSYSDPSHGHTGALYRACNWQWWPTWLRLRTPPSGNGAWTEGQPQEVKDRWMFPIRTDDRRESVLSVDDASAVRYWREHGTESERRWARNHPELGAALTQGQAA